MFKKKLRNMYKGGCRICIRNCENNIKGLLCRIQAGQLEVMGYNIYIGLHYRYVITCNYE